MNTAKQCRNCGEATSFSTGSTIFYICKQTNEYRSVSDHCNIDEAA